MKNTNIRCDYNLFKESHQIQSIKQLLTLIDSFVESTIDENISEKDKLYLTTEIKYQYDSKIKIHFDFFKDNKSSNLEQCSLCNKYHKGIPDDFYGLIESINNRLEL